MVIRPDLGVPAENKVVQVQCCVLLTLCQRLDGKSFSPAFYSINPLHGTHKGVAGGLSDPVPTAVFYMKTKECLFSLVAGRGHLIQ